MCVDGWFLETEKGCSVYFGVMNEFSIHDDKCLLCRVTFLLSEEVSWIFVTLEIFRHVDKYLEIEPHFL